MDLFRLITFVRYPLILNPDILQFNCQYYNPKQQRLFVADQFTNSIRSDLKHAVSWLCFDYCMHQDFTLSEKQKISSFPLAGHFIPTQVLENYQFPEQKSGNREISFTPLISRAEYLSTFNKIKQHIQLGDVYELNFCLAFEATNVEINPYAIFNELEKINKTQQSCLLKIGENFLICGSPERFIMRDGDKLSEHPIKGTIARGETQQEDEANKINLQNNIKERAENIMIVDLVRNDLSKLAQKGTVVTEELCKIYTFPNLHQMESTVACQLKSGIDFNGIINATFPMGSMTGAPKHKAVELINTYEKFNRGIYSGTVGYIEPSGNFDFNVVIRSLIYNREKKYLSFAVGSAITHFSNAEYEYNECLLKAQSLLKAVNGYVKEI